MGEVDRLRLGRVLMNLLTNAMKFTPPGGRVVVKVVRDGDEVEICVSDSGPGIEAGDLGSIFERYRQGRAERIRGSYGLGLYIARAIVTAHDGRIWADRGDEGGAKFCVRLPVTVPARAPVA